MSLVATVTGVNTAYTVLGKYRPWVMPLAHTWVQHPSRENHGPPLSPGMGKFPDEGDTVHVPAAVVRAVRRGEQVLASAGIVHAEPAGAEGPAWVGLLLDHIAAAQKFSQSLQRDPGPRLALLFRTAQYSSRFTPPGLVTRVIIAGTPKRARIAAAAERAFVVRTLRLIPFPSVSGHPPSTPCARGEARRRRPEDEAQCRK